MEAEQLEQWPYMWGPNTSWSKQEVPQEMELYAFTLRHSNLSARRQDNSITHPCSMGPLSVCECVWGCTLKQDAQGKEIDTN